jgi:hypothetical protein
MRDRNRECFLLTLFTKAFEKASKKKKRGGGSVDSEQEEDEERKSECKKCYGLRKG